MLLPGTSTTSTISPTGVLIFDCFVDLLEKYKPKYFLHGHIHQTYGVHIPQKTIRGDTTIINSYDHYEFVF